MTKLDVKLPLRTGDLGGWGDTKAQRHRVDGKRNAAYFL